MAVLQIGENRRDQRLDDLGLVQSAEKSQRNASDVLVRVLKIVAEVLADEDHLREDLAFGVGFLYDLKVEEEELLDCVVLGGQYVSDDGDEELGNGVAVEEEHDGLLEGFDLQFDVVSF